MEAIKCKACGSNSVVKKNGVYVCQYCGTEYTPEEAKIISGSVKIDRTEETSNLLLLARRAIEDKNYRNAEKYYGEVLKQQPNNWEAAFYYTFSHAMQTNIADISSAAVSVSNNVKSSMNLIADFCEGTEQKDAVFTIITESKKIVAMLSTASVNNYTKFAKLDGQFEECSGRLVNILKIYHAIETSLKIYFNTEEKPLLHIQKEEVNYLLKYGKFFNDRYKNTQVERLSKEIKEKEPGFKEPNMMNQGARVVLDWVLCVMNIMAGVGSLGNGSPLTGILYILIGVAVMPIDGIWDLWIRFFGKKSTWVRPLLICLVFFIAAAANS